MEPISLLKYNTSKLQATRAKVSLWDSFVGLYQPALYTVSIRLAQYVLRDSIIDRKTPIIFITIEIKVFQNNTKYNVNHTVGYVN